MSLVKKYTTVITSHSAFCARCPVCGVSLLSHESVVFVLCVLPWIPRLKLYIYIYIYIYLYFVSDGLMLAYTAGNRP